MRLEIGCSYNIREGRLDFTGQLLDIYDDGTCLVMSVGTGSRYKINKSSIISKA